jgi:PAS domain-containing protein
VLTEAVLEAMPVGVAVVDAARRLVLFNGAYHDSLDMPPNSFYRGMSVADGLRVAAYHGVYGPGDPEAQIAAFLRTDRTRPGRLRRRAHNGRSFDVLQAPLPDGGYVVCAVETTALVAARAGAEKALGRVMATLAALRTGLAAFGPDGALLFGNLSFADLLGLTPSQPPQGVQFGAFLDLLATREEFLGLDGESFIAAQRQMDRSRSSTMRRLRATVARSSISSPTRCPMAAGP